MWDAGEEENEVHFLLQQQEIVLSLCVLVGYVFL